jgi:putative peptidoglycan lipid II flippase
MGQLTLLVLTAMASFFAPGSISIFTFAFNLQAVPLAIIGVSYSVAAFPTLTRLHAAGERVEFLRHVEAALRHMLFWAIPATVLIIVLRAQLVRTILGAGAFDWDATRLTAAALSLLVVSLCAQSITLLLSRAYYAAGETWRPLQCALLSVVVALVSAFGLVALFHSNELWRNFLESILRVSDIPGTTVLMLALGYCMGALLQAGVALYYFSKDFSFPLQGLWRLVFECFGSAVIGGACAYTALSFTGNVFDISTAMGVVLQGLAGGVVGLATTVLLLVLLRNQELVETYGALRRKFVKEPPAVEVSEVA